MRPEKYFQVIDRRNVSRRGLTLAGLLCATCQCTLYELLRSDLVTTFPAASLQLHIVEAFWIQF